MRPGLPASRVEAGRSLVLDFGERDRARPTGSACSSSAWRRRHGHDAAPLKIAIVAGEESGDLLGADIVRGAARGDRARDPAGRRRRPAPAGAGTEIAVRCRRHRADGHFGGAARPAAPDPPHRPDGARDRREAPDCLITIDSPDFTLRVAKKVRAANPLYPDHPLCLPERLGLAAGPGAGDEALCRPHPVHPALRGRRTGAARRTAGHLCRPPAGQRSGNPRRRRGAGTAARPVGRRARRRCCCCPARAAARSSGCSNRSAKPFRCSGSAAMRLRLVLPTVPHVADMVAQAVAGWEQQARDRHRRRRRSGRPSARPMRR